MPPFMAAFFCADSATVRGMFSVNRTVQTMRALERRSISDRATRRIGRVRQQVDRWRTLPASRWRVTPETARLLQHWRSHKFSGLRPFFCQIEAVETAIWLSEVAPAELLPDVERARIVITNYHAFKRRERIELSRGGRSLLQGRGETLDTLETEGQILQRVMPELMGMRHILAINDEGTLFPWTVSDFSLMDAIECGIVKLPRVPVADNIPSGDMPRFRDLWQHIGTRMPKKGRGKAKTLDPLSLPVELQTALEALYGHYKKTFELWERAGIRVPPCFIVVCNNTSTSKLVYDFISGFHREREDGARILENGRLPLLRNFDEHGNPLARPRTLLIDSEQLESGDALDKNFRAMAADEIERFRREIVERSSDRRQAENVSEQDLLREVMNTVGKPGRLGDSVRCVVSVSMLTEGWDANTVTHVLGVRAFGAQLLCEQVIGRALRRQSYELNEDNRFNVEYADVLGIPFDFTARPVIAPPQPPQETIQVRAVRPERDALEMRFPRVAGYRVELPRERLTAQFTPDSVLELTPDLVGPSRTQNAGIIGEDVNLSLEHLQDLRRSTLLFHITQHLLYTQWRGPGAEPKLHLFGQLKRITKQWLDSCLVCKGGAYPAQLMYQELADMACSRITAAITLAEHSKDRPIRALLDPYNPTGSTAHVNFNTSRTRRWQSSAQKSHINWVILDSDWEAEFCRVAEAHPRVIAYVKNHSLGLQVPYRYGSETRQYQPDFIVHIDDGRDDPLNLIVEIKGFRREDAKEKKLTMDSYWIAGVNNLQTYGRWAFAEFTDVFDMQGDFAKRVEEEFGKMIDATCKAAASA